MTFADCSKNTLEDMDTEGLGFRVTSGLCAGFREWNKRCPQTFDLPIRYRERVGLNTPRETSLE